MIRGPRYGFGMVALAVALGTTACARFRSGDRANAVQRLREVDGLLTDVDRAYSAGKQMEAKQFATKVGREGRRRRAGVGGQRAHRAGPHADRPRH